MNKKREGEKSNETTQTEVGEVPADASNRKSDRRRKEGKGGNGDRDEGSLLAYGVC